MPPFTNPYQQALDSLKTLGRGVYGTVPGSVPTPSEIQDPIAQLYSLQDQRESELKRNIAAGGAGPVGPANLADLQKDIAENPITQQRDQVAAINAANQKGIMQGFVGAGGVPSSPAQQAAIAGRAMEQRKIDVPVEAERLRAGGALDVERLRQKGFEQRYNELLQVLRGGDLPPGLRVSMPGGGGIVTGPSVPAGAGGPLQKQLDTLMQSRSNLETPGPVENAQDWLARIGTPGMHTIESRKAALDQQIQALRSELTGGTAPRVGTPPPPATGAPGGPTSVVPSEVRQLLQTAAPGRHRLTDGSIWIKNRDGSILKAQ